MSWSPTQTLEGVSKYRSFGSGDIKKFSLGRKLRWAPPRTPFPLSLNKQLPVIDRGWPGYYLKGACNSVLISPLTSSLSFLKRSSNLVSNCASSTWSKLTFCCNWLISFCIRVVTPSSTMEIATHWYLWCLIFSERENWQRWEKKETKSWEEKERKIHNHSIIVPLHPSH